MGSENYERKFKWRGVIEVGDIIFVKIFRRGKWRGCERRNKGKGEDNVFVL